MIDPEQNLKAGIVTTLNVGVIGIWSSEMGASLA